MDKKNKIINLTEFIMAVLGMITIMSYVLFYFYNTQYRWGLAVGSVALVGLELLWIGKLIYKGEKKEK